MKKKTRRILSFALVMVMLFSVAGTASATGTCTWTNSDGVSCTANVTKDADTYIVKVPIKDSSVIDHAEGQAEIITWPTGHVATQAASFSGTVPVAYSIYLRQAATNEGLSLSMSSIAVSYDYYVLDADLPDGTYSFGAEFTVCDASWNIIEGAIAGYAASYSRYTGEVEGSPISRTAPKLIVVSD